MITLTKFLTDMRDSNTSLVSVTEADMRKFTQQAKQWELLAKQQLEELRVLRSRVLFLNDSLEALKKNELERGVILDLFN